MKLLLLLLPLTLLAGCAGLKPADGPAPTPQQSPAPVAIAQPEAANETDEVLALLAFYGRVQGLPAEDLRKEYAAANQAFTRDRSESARLRLAMLLSVPGAPFRDDGRLLSLLESSRPGRPRTARAASW